MWEADFDTVDEAISDGFEEDEGFVVLWVEDDLLEFALKMALSMRTRHVLDMQLYLESLDVVHLWSVLVALRLVFWFKRQGCRKETMLNSYRSQVVL